MAIEGDHVRHLAGMAVAVACARPPTPWNRPSRSNSSSMPSSSSTASVGKSSHADDDAGAHAGTPGAGAHRPPRPGARNRRGSGRWSPARSRSVINTQLPRTRRMARHDHADQRRARGRCARRPRSSILSAGVGLAGGEMVGGAAQRQAEHVAFAVDPVEVAPGFLLIVHAAPEDQVGLLDDIEPGRRRNHAKTSGRSARRGRECRPPPRRASQSAVRRAVASTPGRARVTCGVYWRVLHGHAEAAQQPLLGAALQLHEGRDRRHRGIDRLGPGARRRRRRGRRPSPRRPAASRPSSAS